MNERSDDKTDITFELRIVENLRRSTKGKMSLFIYTVLFTCTVLSILLFTTLFTYPKWWCGINWWGVTIPLEKILVHCWSVTWQHVSGPKIVRMVHAYSQDYFQPNRIIIQAGSSRMVKPRTIDRWRGAILSVQIVFNLIVMIYSMYL